MRSLTVAAACVGLITQASAQSQQLTPYYRVVEHGHSIKLSSYGSFAADCTALGRATLNLVNQPQGGQVETEAGFDFPNFPQSNIRFACDRKRGPETLLFYHASAAFTGTDNFTIEAVFPGGEARQERWTVYVR